MALAVNPLYAPIILENRGQRQIVLGRVRFLGSRFGLACDTLSIRAGEMDGIDFTDADSQRVIKLRRTLDPADPTKAKLVISSDGEELADTFFRILAVLVEKLNAATLNVEIMNIDTSLRIRTQGPQPKLPANIQIYNQGQTVPLVITRNIFAYLIVPGQPNIIRFDLTNFPACMVFIRNRFGTAVLQVQKDVDDNGILTITGIPPDAENPAFCSAMLMIV
jgi:hypothetical protein